MCLVAALGALAVASAPAAAKPVKLASYAMPSAVSAYRDVAAWNAYDPATKRYTLTVRRAGTIAAVDFAPRKRPFDVAVGRGPDGAPLVVLAACPAGHCGVYAVRPTDAQTHMLAASSPGATPQSPSVWGRRVAWVEARRKPDRYAVYTASNPGERRLVRRFPAQQYVGATALLGNELALDVGPRTDSDDERIVVQRLDGARRHTVGHTSIGEGGQTFVGLSFSGRSLYWARVCQGDTSGCPTGIAYRYRDGAYAHAPVPSDLAGFAMTPSGAYWMTEQFGDCDAAGRGSTCDLEYGVPAFKPGHEAHDGP
jgi:hypothetical protein